MKFTNNTGQALHIPSLDVCVAPGDEFEANGDAAVSFEAQGFPRAESTTKTAKAAEKEA